MPAQASLIFAIIFAIAAYCSGLITSEDCHNYCISKGFTEFTHTENVCSCHSVPSKPVNVKIMEISDTKIRLSWFQSERPYGVIVGYRLYYMNMNKNYTNFITLRNPLSRMESLLTDLEPYTTYKIWLKAFTAKYEGEPSDLLTVYTDVQGPSAPNIVNLTCQSNDSLFLQWESPHVYYHQIDYYYIYITSDADKIPNEIKVEAGNNRLDHVMIIPNLTTNSTYEVKVRGATKSLFESARVYKGLYSEPRKVQLSASCDDKTAEGNCFNYCKLLGYRQSTYSTDKKCTCEQVAAADAFLRWLHSRQGPKELQSGNMLL